jgi:hypothetical protein
MRQPIGRLILLAVAPGFSGCGGEYAARNFPARSADVAAEAPATPASVSPAKVEDAPPPAKPAPGAADAEAADKSQPLPRKIIYNAQVTLVVESVADFGRKLGDLVKQAGGYISATDQTSYSGARRGASWTIRVPVDKFDGLFATIGRMGELQQSHLDTQDVSQEYYDIEARITNKQQEEKRLLKHLADSTGKLEDILAVERELTRVRGEIEQMQGRIRYLSNVTAYSTVTINATELVDFTPPVRPTFKTQIGRTFGDSVGNLMEFVRACILVAVAIAPWLPILVLIALPVFWMIRRRRGRRTPPMV